MGIKKSQELCKWVVTFISVVLLTILLTTHGKQYLTIDKQFAVATGEITLTTATGDIGNSLNWSNNQATINYPSGFTKENCIVNAVGFKLKNRPGDGFSFYSYDFTDALSMLRGNMPHVCTLNSNNIVLEVRNYTGGERVLNYKILLMRTDL